MRITQSMLTSNFLDNLTRSYDRLGKYQDQLESGKKISRPSDDPVVAMNGILYRTDVKEIEQYKNNINEVYVWMDNSDDILDKTTQVLHRIRDLTEQASNDTYEEKQRKDMAKEIEQLTDHIKDLFNTQIAGKYIFNGTDTTNPPIHRLDDGSYVVSTNNQSFNIEVLPSIQIGVNVTATDMFPQTIDYQDPDYKAFIKDPTTGNQIPNPNPPVMKQSPQLFEMLGQLKETLTTRDANTGKPATGDEIGKYLAEITAHMDHLIAQRSELGARMNRVQMIDDRLEEQEVSAKKMISDNEDVDYEKVIMNLKIQESIHRAALAVGARIIQPTLIDFLK